MRNYKYLDVAKEVGLIIERQELGYRVSDARGHLIGSQLPIDLVAGFIRSRLKSAPRAFADGTELQGCAFPAL